MNKKLLLLLSIPVLTLAVLACNGKGKGGDNWPAPVIESVSTANEGNTAVAGKPVYLIGAHFSPVADENQILVGIGMDADKLPVIDASENQLVFLAPALSKTSIKVRVSTRGKESNQVEIAYYIPAATPVITGITTSYENNVAVAGEPVTLAGQHFSATRAKNKVLYGEGSAAVSLPVTSATETQLVFKAPDVDVTALKIRVSTDGAESNEVELAYPAWSDTPSLTLPGASSVTVVPGVEWISFHGVWEGSIRNINIVKTTLDQHNKLGIFFNYRTDPPAGYPSSGPEEDYRDLDKKCIWLDAVAGTNGPMACCQFVRVNGHEENPPVDADDWIENCAITIDGNGSVVDIVPVSSNFEARKLTNSADGITFDPPVNTLTVGCAGPLLVYRGAIHTYKEQYTADFLKTTHPRTAIGLSRDGKTIIQVAVDGRWSKTGWPAEQTAIGMSTAVLAKLLKGLGCYKAMNLDGGGGTAMWVYGQGNARNIVNHVCENRWDWDGTVLRPTGCAVYVKSDLK